MAERTLIWDEFDYVFQATRRRLERLSPIRNYRNPLFLAREWKKALDSGEYASQTALALKSAFPQPGSARCSGSSSYPAESSNR